MNLDKPILVYDSDCVLCSRTVRFVVKHEVEPSLLFASFESDIVRDLNIDSIPIDPNSRDTLLYISGDVILTRSRAAFAVADKLHRPYRWISYGRYLPRWLTDGVYRIVAKNRIRLFGKEADRCELSDHLHDRYLP